MIFKIATWNINSVRLRLAHLFLFLERYQPDILCLQEIKCTNEQFPAQKIAAFGYPHQAVNGQKAYHGVATISRHPFTTIQSRDFCDSGDARHIATKSMAGNTMICVHNFYVPAGGDKPDPHINPKFAHKLQFIDAMNQIGCQDENIPAILAGDLNIAPLETDVWSHKQLLNVVSHTPIETNGLKRIIASGGWIDLVRQWIPAETKLYTWWSYRAYNWRESNRGRRLDHIWSAPLLASSLIGIDVLRDVRDWEKPSDHVPVIATFNLEI